MLPESAPLDGAEEPLMGVAVVVTMDGAADNVLRRPEDFLIPPPRQVLEGGVRPRGVRLEETALADRDGFDAVLLSALSCSCS